MGDEYTQSKRNITDDIGDINTTLDRALVGNKTSKSIAESTTNEAYFLYQTIKECLIDSKPSQNFHKRI